MNPPTVIIHGNHLDGVKQDYIRFLESFYRKAFDLTGTPLRIQLKNSTNPFDERAKLPIKKLALFLEEGKKQLFVKK